MEVDEPWSHGTGMECHRGRLEFVSRQLSPHGGVVPRKRSLNSNDTPWGSDGSWILPTRWFLRLLLAWSLGLGPQTVGAAPQSATGPGISPGSRFVQDRFGIGFWVAPQTDENLDARYGEIAEANFTFVIGLCGGNHPVPPAEQLELCRKHDLKALISMGKGAPDAWPDHPALWGYLLMDEPSARQFSELRSQVDAIRLGRPGKLAYINLFPNYASAEQLGTPSYEDHVNRFIAEVRPDVLSMDHYPRFGPGRDGRDKYCQNLAVMRQASLAAGIPFWNFFNTMPYGPHTDPTEAQLRWQIYASVAYGARGVMYFCYWTPRGDEFPKGGAILTAAGRRTRHYDEAKRLNAALKQLGPTLMCLTSTRVQRVTRLAGDPSPAGNLEGSSIRAVTEGDFLIGSFRHSDGRRAVLIMNHEFAYSAWPTVEFDADPSQVLEVSPKTGRAERVRDDSPDMPGLQISLDAGEGRLFLLPAAPTR